MGANVFRSVLGPWGLSRSRGTQPLSSSGSGPEQRGVGVGVGVEPAQHCRGEPGRLARQGTGLRPRQTREDSADNGWEAGRDRRDQEHGK